MRGAVHLPAGCRAAWLCGVSVTHGPYQGRAHLKMGPNTLVYSNVLCDNTNNQLLPPEPGFARIFSCLGCAVRLWEGCRSHLVELSGLQWIFSACGLGRRLGCSVRQLSLGFGWLGGHLVDEDFCPVLRGETECVKMSS